MFQSVDIFERRAGAAAAARSGSTAETHVGPRWTPGAEPDRPLAPRPRPVVSARLVAHPKARRPDRDAHRRSRRAARAPGNDRCGPARPAVAGSRLDGEPLLQSSGTGRILDALRELERRGFTYPCVCSRGDVRSAQSAPQLGDAVPRYTGTCRGRFDSVELAARSTGRPVGIRFKVAEGITEFHDGIAGVVRCDIARDAGDFLIGKRDGAPAYQLAVVVDDATRVTEVAAGLPSPSGAASAAAAGLICRTRAGSTCLCFDETAASGQPRRSQPGRSAGCEPPESRVAWASRAHMASASDHRRAAIPGVRLRQLPRAGALTQAAISELQNQGLGRSHAPRISAQRHTRS